MNKLKNIIFYFVKIIFYLQSYSEAQPLQSLLSLSFIRVKFCKFSGKICAINATDLEINFTVDVTGFDNADFSITDPAGTPFAANYIVTKITDKKYEIKSDTAMGLGEYTLKINKDAVTSVADATVKNPLQYIKFDGSAAADTIAPTIKDAEYDNITQKVTVNFSEDVSQSSLDKTKFTVTDGTTSVVLGVNDVATFPSTSSMVITPSSANKTAIAALGEDLSLVVAEGAIQDIAKNNMAAATVSLASTAQLKAAAYDAQSNVMTVEFTKPVDVSTLTIGQLAFSSSAGPNIAFDTADIVQTTDDGTTVSVKLAEDANTVAFEASGVTSRTLTLTQNTTFVTTDSKQVQTSTVGITFTADAVAPTLTSGSYNRTGNKLILNFSEPVDTASLGTIKITNLVDSAGAAVTGDITLDAADLTSPAAGYGNVLVFEGTANGVNDTLAVADAEDQYLTSDSKVYMSKDALVDGSGNKSVVVSSENAVALSYIDQTAPTLTATATQLSKSKIKIAFNKEVTEASAEELANYAITAAGSADLTIKSASLLSDEKTVVVETNEEGQVGVTYTVKATNVLSKFGNVAVDTSNNTATWVVSNSTDTTAPQATAVAFKDVNGNYDVDAGDTLTLTFDEAIVVDSLDKDDFTLSSARVFGTGATFVAGAAENKVVITLGTGEDIEFDDTITQEATPHIKSLTGVNSQQSAALQIKKADETKPEITEAKYEDTVNDGKVDTGDTVTLTFSEDLDRSINASDILGAGGLGFADASDEFGTGASAEYLDARTIRVTLGTGVQLDGAATGTTLDAASATVTFGATATVKDLWGNQGDSTQTPVAITADDVTRPEVTGIEIKKAVGKTGAKFETGDMVKVTFSENVNPVSADATDLIFYTGTTALLNGTPDIAMATSVSGNVVTYTVTVTPGTDTLYTTDLTNITSVNLTPAGSGHVTDAVGNTSKPAVGFGVSPTLTTN